MFSVALLFAFCMLDISHAFLGIGLQAFRRSIVNYSSKLTDGLSSSIEKRLQFSGHISDSPRQSKFSLSPLTAATLDELDTPTPLSSEKRGIMENFIKNIGGKRVIQRILIANNGMAATKAIMSMRQWAYMNLGDERAIEFIAMATKDDLNANAEFIRLADTFVEVPSGSNKNNYANVDLIVSIAEAQKVDAVWPGWGHASENPRLPRTLKAKGIQFIGPSSSVMAALGDKISANILAQSAKVPSIPWSGDGITFEVNKGSDANSETVIPKNLFDKACVFSVDDAKAVAEKIGYPVMIKASEGGGGKGIRMSNNIDELKTNFIQVQNEVPGSPVFMMKLCTNARHIEVQIVGDEYGNAVALNGRDCSTQRRFQKIFEEGPPSIVPRDVFRQMEQAAQRLTQSIGYVGAGTVEYLYNEKENKYYFLELNPRLQVEHPVTEGITNINLPALQLQVSMGIPLYRIPEVREFYGKSDIHGSDKIDFFEDKYVYPAKHVIAARITAENPDEGFKPTSGKIERVKFQSNRNVWGYFSVGANGGIHEFADSQFGHLFASGATREEARRSLVLALKGIDVRGDIRTTVEYLIKLLETPEFKDNTIDTSWLDGIIKQKSVSTNIDPQVVALSAAVFKTHSIANTQMKDLQESLGKGQASLQSIPSILNFPIEIIFDNVKYLFSASMLGPNIYTIKINDQDIEVRIREQPDKSLLCSIAGESYQLFGQEEALGLRMKINDATAILPTVYNPSELRSDVTGKIVRYLQIDGEEVAKDQPYVEVEAMKMIMSVKSSEAGIITQNLPPGSIIQAGDLMATLKLKDPSKVKPIVTFKDRLNIVPVSGPRTLEAAMERISLVLDGYDAKDFESDLQIFIQSKLSVNEILDFLILQLKKFLNSEKIFANDEDDAVVVSNLVKSNKDNLPAIIPQLLAHKQLKPRSNIMLSLLRTLEILPEKTKDFKLSQAPDALTTVLDGLSSLSGAAYREIALKCKQLQDTGSLPSFGSRLNLLKERVIAAGTELNSLAIEPNIAVSIDLLVVLMADHDANVRKAAMEVYIRRVYRSHVIKSLSITEIDGKLEAQWSFTIRDTDGSTARVRKGYMVMYPNLSTIDKDLPSIISRASTILIKNEKSAVTEPLNVLHVGISEFGSRSQDECASSIQSALSKHIPALKLMDVRMANFLLVQKGEIVNYYNYYSDIGYFEDPVSRNMRPTMPALLEINRLSTNYELTRLQALGRNSYMFLGKEKLNSDKKQTTKGDKPPVLFLRTISLSSDANSIGGAERVFLMALDEVERAFLDPRVGDTTSSRMYLNILPELKQSLDMTVKQFRLLMDGLVSKYASKLLRLRVDEIEVKIRIIDEKEGSVPIRLMASSSGGGWLTRSAYREYLDPITGQTLQYCSLNGDDICVLDPYPTSGILEAKRATARKVGSTYANDFHGLIEVALINTWSKHLEEIGSRSSIPPSPYTFEELVLDKKGELKKEKRFPGTNKIGMLAWLTKMKSPQFPEGREVLLIANDVTVQSGSFGVLEDEFFFKASEYARVRGIPRIFLSCNSGARIGLVEELKPKFKVAWKDESNPLLGFDYLYLTEDDYLGLVSGTVDATKKISPTGDVHYMLDAIIGQIHGIGVENLRGSGLIAGETSRAYDETFTLSYVTGRSVGIGAYLNRLGQRVIQMQQGPMILTGYSALNKLLGREVYTSQDQLGGPQIMYNNGVSHEVVDNDKDGMQAVVDWLSFVPNSFTSFTPEIKTGDPVSRDIEFFPTKAAYDPRHMLAGVQSDGNYVSGFFDKGSFKEYLGGWGKTVVAGRARLGGINVGVIAVETRSVEQKIPADPGNPDSRETIQMQAGQVWYPDSAFKTAQVINDFNRGENLPLIIFANWRGFSGGTRDMYHEILKFGAMIVDALRNYKHPVFVYIPPNGELRGGAWVVIDPTINEAKMEMYADSQSRGGILEPPGICEVKYRSQDQKATMHRLDDSLVELDELLANTHDDSGDTMTSNIAKDIKAREKVLGSVYLQVAHEFADLHDRAGRMKAKGCISEVLEWRRAREFFYWRIKRRLLEDEIKSKISAIHEGKLSSDAINAKFEAVLPSMHVIASNEEIVQWLTKSKSETDIYLASLKQEFLKANIAKLLEALNPEERKKFL